ncbi:DUF3298 and DUF4163 domain-containing protein [uncultured Maribacter sp.]|uniref:DUF3298 and DUF4163 domain-containing protein n=1 Tax=uncultured Maribacter sp. TaxID=431308 RepID=UPI00262E5DC5|nr:DUF3298 and DUF4163 domain-containing protein [uncultured Maribacter sp.]
MKPIYIAFFFLIIVTSCKDESLLSFEPIVIEEAECDTCPVVKINIPKALENDKIDNAINTAIREEIITLLNFDESVEINSIKTAISSFKNGYSDLMKKFPEESTKWEASITGAVSYEDKNVISIMLTSYLFTGGAHGYTSTRFLNFNKKKGVELENWELFNTDFDFVKFAELKFRIQEDISQNAPINNTGFMFEDDSYSLPANIGYTKNGLQLLYNQYEIASYADGPITLTIPYSEVKKYLLIKLKL